MNKENLLDLIKHKEIPEIYLPTGNLDVGDIILHRSEFKATRPSSYPAPPIRLIAHTFFNHLSVVNYRDSDRQEEKVIVEAVGRGVLPTEITERLKGCTVLVLRPKTEYQPKTLEEQENLIKRINSKIGTKYDFGGCFIHQAIFNITGKWIGRTLKAAESKFYCYEFGAWIWNKIPFLKYWWKIKPKAWIESIDVFTEILYYGKIVKIK